MTAPTVVPAPDPTPARGAYYPLNDPRVTAAVDALYEARKAVVAEMLYAQHFRDSYSPAEHQRLIAASSAAATNAQAAIYDLAAALVADGAAS